MFSLVVLCCESFEFSHSAFTGFASEAEATEFAVGKLVEVGEVVKVDGGWQFKNETDVFETQELVLESWQEGLEPLSFFHVVPSVELTPTTSREAGASV